MIEGLVLRVEGLSSAVKVSLGDDTGEIVVLIWRNVLDRIVSSAGLGTPGSRVRVVGTVEIYRSNLEVIPALPVDVTVLTLPQD
jgi:DNA/RNA endonuclease YhcR with UshA esterase domain